MLRRHQLGNKRERRERERERERRERGEVFQGYREGAINFLPTYKYIPGGGVGAWDRAEDGKKRAPAWCDRILFWHHRDVKQLSYDST